MLPILGILSAAPAILNAGLGIFRAITGESLPATTTPEELSDKIVTLPPAQQQAVTIELVKAQAALDDNATRRFVALADGDAEKQRATARPEIARRAMGVIEVFAWSFKLLILATLAEYAARFVFALAGWEYPIESLWDFVARLAPAAEVIWAPLISSFLVSAQVIKAYFGARERDKAAEYELVAGKPLKSTEATITAAGGAVAGIIKAVRGK